jgi:hypothetical protein
MSSNIFNTSSFAPPCNEPAKVPTAADTEANGLASVEAVTIAEKVLA